MNVSIIIPAFNAASTIGETVASVIAQTVACWEAVIVDDGSTDRTGKLADKFERQDARIRVIHQPNGGESAARNAGLLAARHEWILFLDADDYIAPQYLERMCDALTANPGLDAVHCGWARIAADGTQLVDRYEPPTGDMFDVWAQRSAFPVHACIVRASRIADVGPFDTSLRKSADWDLWQRIARTGAQFGAVREVLAFYRMGASSASLEAPQMLEDGLRVLRRGHGPDPRVAHPDPRHVKGRDAALIPNQAFYLMCWCGGLLIGQDEDARPLLRQLAGMRFPELHPPAVARCIFDAAPLPARAAPIAWETLWPRVHQLVDAFLVAVEEHAGAPDLAAQARLALMRMSLANSSSWRPVVDADDARRAQQEGTITQQLATIGQHEETITQQLATIGQLEGTITQQLATIGQQEGTITQQRATIGQQEGTITQQQATIGQQEGTIKQQLATIGQQLAMIARLEDGRRNAQRLNEEQAQALETSAARITDLEQASALLERDRAEWRRVSEDRAEALEKSAALITELDDLQARLRTDVGESERLSDKRAMLLADLRAKAWVRLGLRLGLLKALPEVPEPAHEVPAGRLKRLVLPPGSLALGGFSPAALSGEVLARIEAGAFSGDEEAILLGCELREALERALDVHNNRWSARRYRDLFGDLFGSLGLARPSLDGATVVDLGCGGRNPYGVLFLFLMLGAKRGIAVDLDEIQDTSRAARALADLAGILLVNPGEILGDYAIAREQMLRNIASFDLAKLQAGDPTGLDPARLSYRRESVHTLSSPDGVADIVISNSFFEHIQHADEAIAQIARITRPGGLGIHLIDGSDHRRYEDSSRHPLDFLTEAGDAPMVYGSNRIRPMEFGPLFERHGFEVVSFVSFVPPDHASLPASVRARLREPFRSMPDAVLSAYMGKIVVRKL